VPTLGRRALLELGATPERGWWPRSCVRLTDFYYTPSLDETVEP
jgi:hypothetical protein